ncbi:hypothetical protein FEM48_Zijuj05G0057100 [Ziziphus jujuba var. spinosa]|uniref:phosphopantothenoylcysteine decarboxylase n=2 Tax=Ziziphus jujuba TaxID=326968 RepID=A0A978VD53_ZIZJJ|nr:hypothetical protein FEM48_Zijuj05G0057100 [Ziziphus jujuba var. spinosa]
MKKMDDIIKFRICPLRKLHLLMAEGGEDGLQSASFLTSLSERPKRCVLKLSYVASASSIAALSERFYASKNISDQQRTYLYRLLAVRFSCVVSVVMANPEPVVAAREMIQVNPVSRKPRILLAASGSVAAIKFGNLCHCFSDWAEVRAVVTKASLHFIDRASLPKDVILFTDEDEWSSWNKIGDSVLHIELRRWADIMVVAPLSANTLGKIAGGLCDNLLTCIVRAWDYSKPFFVAPAMNTFMWTNPFTQRHLTAIEELGISVIQPVTKKLACGDYGNGAMAEISIICSTVRLFLESRNQQSS